LDRKEAISHLKDAVPDIPLPSLLEPVFHLLEKDLLNIWIFDESAVRALVYCQLKRRSGSSTWRSND
jgi:hypothetical protein